MSGVTPQQLMVTGMQIISGAEKAAAFGAHLRALTESVALPPTVADGVKRVAEVALPGVSEMPAEALIPIKSALIAFFRQAADLLENPDRAPGWLTDDTTVLQAQGRGSSAVVPVFEAAMPKMEGLAERLANGGAFCDVGTGVGWLSITAARTWPTATVLGIDIADNPLALAKENVASVGDVSDRLALEKLNVLELGAKHPESFDLIWLPGPFLPKEIVPDVMASALQALRPGGWVAVGTYAAHQDPIADALSQLRAIRSGGYPWNADELESSLTTAGFERAEFLERTWPAPLDLTVGRRPA